MAIKTQVTFKISEIYYDKIQELVDKKEFGSQSAVCEAAIIEFFMLREMRSSLGPELKRFFGTDEGKVLLSELFAQAALLAYQSKE